MKKTDTSAYPVPQLTRSSGMTLREYAAIHLRVPNSGNDWLDQMIMESYSAEPYTLPSK